MSTASGICTGIPFTTGEVFVGSSNGVIYAYTQCGTLIEAIVLGSGLQEQTGMAFDSSGDLYATALEQGYIQKVSHTDSSIMSPNPFVTDSADGFNESIVFDRSGTMYVGQAGKYSYSPNQVIKWAGGVPTYFSVGTENRGSDWLQLASDQKTLYYTSEGKDVLRYDVSTGTQLANFNGTALPGPVTYSLLILSDGSVLVANYDRIVKLNSAGSVVATYGYNANALYYGLALDPDGISFWATDVNMGVVNRYNISTGTQMTSFPSGAASQLAGGVIVYGLNKDPKTSTLLVWWTPGIGIQTAPCATVIVPSSYEANTYYIGGVFGSAMGLKTDHTSNQSAVTAMSIVRAVVNTTTHNVTCSSLDTGSMNGVYGVSGGQQKVEAITFNSSGDLFVGGSFAAAGGFEYSANFGCFRRGSGGGWNTATYTMVDGEVTSLTPYTHYISIVGSFSTVSGPTVICGPNTGGITGLPGAVKWHDGLPYGSFYCGYFQP